MPRQLALSTEDDGLRRFENVGTGAGEEMILEENPFVEYLPSPRGLSGEAMQFYRRSWRTPGEARRPMLAWTRDLPIDGEPAEMVEVVETYASWLQTCPTPKLFINGDPSGLLIGAQREFCRGPNQQEVTVPGAHLLQEDPPKLVDEAIARLVAGVRAS